jgi:hypothetical protein
MLEQSVNKKTHEMFRILNLLSLVIQTYNKTTFNFYKVLDLGFNGIRQIPNDAFRDNLLLTLLALDGNPLKTVPSEAFQHLNTTLRGLSIGGK